MKTTLQLRSVVIEQCRNVSVAFTLCIMLLTPLLFLGEGLGVRCVAQVANGTGAGNCLNFNGTTNYVQVANAATLNISDGVTLEAWINLTAFDAQDNIVRKGTAPGVGNYHLCIVNGKVLFNFYANETWRSHTSPNTLNNNTWYHIAATYDNSTTVKIYENGQEVLSETENNSMVTNTQPLTIGVSEFASWAYFNGQIDEVRVWNRVLTQTEIRDNMCKKLTGGESGLVGYWRFDEGSGSTVYDASGNGNNGTLY